MPIQEDVWQRDAADELFDAIDPGRWGKRLLVLRWIYRATAERQLVSESRVYAQASTHDLAERWGLDGHGWPMRVLRQLVRDGVLDRIEASGRRPSAYAIEWRWWLWAQHVPWLVPRETVQLRMETAVLRRVARAPQALVVARRGDTYYAPQPAVVARKLRATKSPAETASGAPERAATSAPYVSSDEVSPSFNSDGRTEGASQPEQGPHKRARDVLGDANTRRRQNGAEGIFFHGRCWRRFMALLDAVPSERHRQVAEAIGNTKLRVADVILDSLEAIFLASPETLPAPAPAVPDWKPSEALPPIEPIKARLHLAGVRAALSPSTQHTEVPV